MNTNLAVDGLITELSPELAGVIGQPPEISDSPPPKIPGVSASEKSNIEKQAAAAADAVRTNGISRKFGVLAKTIQGLDRVRVFKRQPNGVVGFIEEYRYRDIQHTGDLEVFLAQYVKPIHGPGEYPIRLWDASGKEWDGGIIHLLGAPPPANAPQNDMATMVRELREALRPAPAPDPLEAMERAQAFAERLKGKSSDPFTMMMMMRAMEPQQPKTDPAIASVLERLAAKIEKLEQQAAAPPMPMLPMAPSTPQPSLVEIVTAVTTGLKAVIDVTRPPPAPAAAAVDPFQIAKMLSEASEKGAAAADKQSERYLRLLEERERQEKPQASLMDEMEKFKSFQEFVKSFGPAPQPQGSTGTNFWDAMLAFANNEKFAGNIGEAIRERAKQPPGQVTITSNKPAQPKQIPPQHVAPPAPPQTPPPPFVPGAPQPVAAAPAQPAPAPAPAPAQPEVVPAAEAAAPPAPAPRPQPRIYVPDTFRPFCERLDQASTELVDLKQADGSTVQGLDDGTIGQRTIEALMELFKLAQWRPSVEALLAAIDQNQKDAAMRGLGNMLKMLAHNGWLKQDSGLNSLRVLHEQWDLIRAGVQQLLKTATIFKTPPAAITPPADPEAPSAPAVTAPSTPAAPADVPDEVLHEIAGDDEEEAEPPPG